MFLLPHSTEIYCLESSVLRPGRTWGFSGGGGWRKPDLCAGLDTSLLGSSSQTPWQPVSPVLRNRKEIPLFKHLKSKDHTTWSQVLGIWDKPRQSQKTIWARVEMLLVGGAPLVLFLAVSTGLSQLLLPKQLFRSLKSPCALGQTHRVSNTEPGNHRTTELGKAL